VVTEGDTLERDGVVEAVDHVGVGRVGDGGLGVEQLEDPLHRAHRLLHGVGHAGELADRPVQQEHRGGEGEELPGRERARDDAVAAVPEGAHDAERAQHLHERLRELIGAVVLEGQAQELVVDAVEPLLLESLAAEGLHDLGAREGFLEHHVELGHLLLGALVDLVQLAPQGADGHRHRGEHRHRDERQHPFPREHHHEQRDDGADLPDRHHQHGGREAGEPVDVGDDARHQLGGVQRGEEGQRHALDVAVELAPNARDHALTHRGHEVGLAEAGGALDEVGAQHGDGDQLQHHEIAVEEDAVHRGLHEPRDEALGG
jgi:hypothetical protein